MLASESERRVAPKWWVRSDERRKGLVLGRQRAAEPRTTNGMDLVSVRGGGGRACLGMQVDEREERPQRHSY